VPAAALRHDPDIRQLQDELLCLAYGCPIRFSEQEADDLTGRFRGDQGMPCDDFLEHRVDRLDVGRLRAAD
jgi:hypothetical protein